MSYKFDGSMDVIEGTFTKLYDYPITICVDGKFTAPPKPPASEVHLWNYCLSNEQMIAQMDVGPCRCWCCDRAAHDEDMNDNRKNI